jgi:hypothetical protein
VQAADAPALIDYYVKTFGFVWSFGTYPGELLAG